MKDEVLISLRSLTEKERKSILKILEIITIDIPCEVNEKAIIDIKNFNE